MLGRCTVFGILGAAALVLGMLLFIAGDFSTNWARWVFGPLLWFVGCALVICWAFSASWRSERRAGYVRDVEKIRAAKKAG